MAPVVLGQQQGAAVQVVGGKSPEEAAEAAQKIVDQKK